MAGADLIVTNFNRNFTGVSATAAAVVREHQKFFDMRTVGHPLPGCNTPITKSAALRFAHLGPATKPCQIWHVRRDPEMQTALFARDILRLPIRIVFTSAAQRRHSAWPRWLIVRMDAVIATTPAAADQLTSYAATIPHGVDTIRFHPAPDREKAWAVSGFPGKIGIACVGRIRPEKGTDRFIETAIRTIARLPDTVALIIGRAKPEHDVFLATLKRRVAQAGLVDKILFVGEVSPEKLPELLRSLSLLVALPVYEGYGMTPLEAMASGVPVVASDTGYFQEFIGQNQAGFVVRQGDPDQAAAKAVEILEDNTGYIGLSQRCVQRARDCFGITQEADKITAVYNDIWENFVPAR